MTLHLQSIKRPVPPEIVKPGGILYEHCTKIDVLCKYTKTACKVVQNSTQ